MRGALVFGATLAALALSQAPRAASAQDAEAGVVDFTAERIGAEPPPPEPALSLAGAWRAEGFPEPPASSGDADWRLVDPLYTFEEHGPHHFSWTRLDGCVSGEGIQFQRRVRAEWFYDESCDYADRGGRARGTVAVGDDGAASGIDWTALERIDGEGKAQSVKRRVEFRRPAAAGAAVSSAGYWKGSSGKDAVEYYRIEPLGSELRWTHENGCEAGIAEELGDELLVNFWCNEEGTRGRARGRIERDTEGKPARITWTRVEEHKPQGWAAASASLPALTPEPPPPPAPSLAGRWRDKDMPDKPEFYYELAQDAHGVTSWSSKARCEMGTLKSFRDWARVDWSVLCEAGCSPCDDSHPQGRAIGRIESGDRIAFDSFERFAADGKAERRTPPVVLVRVPAPPSPHAAAAATLIQQSAITPPTAFVRMKAQRFVMGRGLEPEGRSAAGPAALPIELDDVEWKGLSKQDVKLSRLQDLLPIQTRIYPDRNRDSGIFYYVPYRYALARGPDGYDMSVRYRAKDASGANATVIARLDSQIDGRSRDLAKRLIRLYYLEQLIDFEAGEISLQPYPGDATVEVEWAPIARGEMKIATVARLDDQIDLIFTTDPDTARLFIDVIGESGLAGKVGVGAKEGPRPMPADLLLQLERPGTRSSPWLPAAADGHVRFDNPLPAPVALRHLVSLYDEGEALRLVGFRLSGPDGGALDVRGAGRVAVEELGAQALDPTRAVAGWWIYDVRDDEKLRNAAVERIVRTGAADEIVQHNLTLFRSEAVFEKYKLKQLQVEVRSRFFDAANQRVDKHTYTFRAGDEDKKLDPVYPRGATESLYEFRITAVDENGGVHSDGKWRTPSTPEDILIGELQVSEVMTAQP